MEIPEYILKFIRDDRALQNAFRALSPSHQKEYIKWIEEAKKEQTRTRRLEKMRKMILEKVK